MEKFVFKPETWAEIWEEETWLSRKNAKKMPKTPRMKECQICQKSFKNDNDAAI